MRQPRFFVGGFGLLYVFIVLAYQRRRVIHFNVTAHPSSEWTARQIAEAFAWDSAPRYLLHDRDSIYAGGFHDQVTEMGIREVLTAPRSPGNLCTWSGSSGRSAVSVWIM